MVIAVNVLDVARALADLSNFGLLGEQSYTKMGDSLPWTAMNCRAKFDAASVILGGEIRNRTKNTNSNRYIHNLPIGMCG